MSKKIYSIPIHNDQLEEMKKLAEQGVAEALRSIKVLEILIEGMKNGTIIYLNDGKDVDLSSIAEEIDKNSN